MSGLWDGRKRLRIEFMDVRQQLAERAGAMMEQKLTFLGGGLSRVADRACRVKVLGLPCERRRAMRREPTVILLHGDAGRAKFANRIAAHMLLVSRQHDRGLHRTSMYAVAQFFR